MEETGGGGKHKMYGLQGATNKLKEYLNHNVKTF
jgi:TM2 domain-containing membrane protein YozV